MQAVSSPNVKAMSSDTLTQGQSLSSVSPLLADEDYTQFLTQLLEVVLEKLKAMGPDIKQASQSKDNMRDALTKQRDAMVDVFASRCAAATISKMDGVLDTFAPRYAAATISKMDGVLDALAARCKNACLCPSPLPNSVWFDKIPFMFLLLCIMFVVLLVLLIRRR